MFKIGDKGKTRNGALYEVTSTEGKEFHVSARQPIVATIWDGGKKYEKQAFFNTGNFTLHASAWDLVPVTSTLDDAIAEYTAACEAFEKAQARVADAKIAIARALEREP